jgi:hypothetical protein
LGGNGQMLSTGPHGHMKTCPHAFSRSRTLAPHPTLASVHVLAGHAGSRPFGHVRRPVPEKHPHPPATPLHPQHPPASTLHPRASMEQTWVSVDHSQPSMEQTRSSAEHSLAAMEHTRASMDHSRGGMEQPRATPKRLNADAERPNAGARRSRAGRGDGARRHCRASIGVLRTREDPRIRGAKSGGPPAFRRAQVVRHAWLRRSEGGGSAASTPRGLSPETHAVRER